MQSSASRQDALLLSLSKNLLGFSTKSLAGHCACPTEIPLGDARCPLEADNEHTCVLYCILRRVQKVNCPNGTREATLGCAPPQNRFDFICRKRGKLCEAFLWIQKSVDIDIADPGAGIIIS